MAVREFDDERGKRWRVWCITPEAIHPVTRAEDYLADCYQLGWLVFETTSGDDKRRLCPFPKAWESVGDQEIRDLLSKAEAVPTRKLSRERMTEQQLEAPTGVTAAIQGDEDPADLTDLTVVRSFRYPGGRLWTAAVANPVAGGGSTVLRFTAGARSIDLASWPRDWADLPDERLVDLLRHASDRPITTFTPATPRRRHDDPPAGGLTR